MVPMSNVGALETGLGGARVVDGTPLRAGASKPAQTSGDFWEGTKTVLGWVSDTQTRSAEVPSQFWRLVEAITTHQAYSEQLAAQNGQLAAP